MTVETYAKLRCMATAAQLSKGAIIRIFVTKRPLRGGRRMHNFRVIF